MSLPAPPPPYCNSVSVFSVGPTQSGPVPTGTPATQAQSFAALSLSPSSHSRGTVTAHQDSEHDSRLRSPVPATILGVSRPGSLPPHSRTRSRSMSSVRQEWYDKAPSPSSRNRGPKTAYPNLWHGPCRRLPTPATNLGVSRLSSLSPHSRPRSRSMSSVRREGNDKAPQARGCR
ncbi:hypothetical protein NDU88_001239 [Pleurodeles waltl]|uniref:Uncharacterized protein n=1 Tax=Pleurodeles waltl TaxID=8319 RepID=A0AAV7UTH0_PLEWA|nr:hypothetical protein NDU88_001239 [Pleurodeles waltl]